MKLTRLYCKITVFLPVFFLSVNMLFSQGSVSGRIIASDNKLPLAYANVFLQGTHYSSVSDTGGFYIIKNIPEGKYILVAVYMGFNSAFKEITIQKDRNTSCDLSLKEKIFKDFHGIADQFYLPEVFITATRTSAYLKNLPGSNRVITASMIKELPANNIDEILLSQAGVSGDRDKGIFSKNSSVTMRGLNGSYRVLVLVDGVPINKSDGGQINWTRISPALVDRIEISEGPGSAIYGGNAMGGVINIISREPVRKLEGSVRGMFGTYNTFGSIVKLQGTEVSNGKGLYWALNGFYRQGDGYISEPEATRDSTNVPVGIKEYTAGGKIGYHFNSRNSLELEYTWYDDKRADGTRIYDPDGGYFTYNTNFIRSRYRWGNPNYEVEFNAFYQAENYFNQKESLKREKTPPYPITRYVLYNTLSDKIDRGIWCTASRTDIKNHYLTAGFDFKRGSVDGSDYYFTSTDTVTNKGMLDFYALFAQDQVSLLNGKFNIIAGIRVDAAKFHSGEFLIGAPTAETEILIPYLGTYRDTTWFAVSPKLAVQYSISKTIRFYVSAGRGFRPPILDDMCRNGNITKGIKLANPELQPETIDNYEIGGEITSLLKNLTIHPAFYFSSGHDFQYFVGTGDSNYSGNTPKPVLKRENIGEVHIWGAEINLNYNLPKGLSFRFSYAWNQSRITSFDLSKYTGKDLTGKRLMEVSPNQLYTNLAWRNKWFTSSLVFHYVDSRFMDDENITSVPSHHTFDFKITANSWIFKKLSVSLTIQNLTNTVYLDNKNQSGLGRYFLGELNYEF